MKIIDLLNKIANGEEVPKKIKYEDEKFVFSDKTHQYYVGDNSNDINTYYNNSLKERLYDFIYLNDEVEILEEEKKIPEKLEGIDSLFKIEQDLDLKGFLAWQKANNKIIENKINELIDYLKSKGDE